jgi:hypothetical protein
MDYYLEINHNVIIQQGKNTVIHFDVLDILPLSQKLVLKLHSTEFLGNTCLWVKGRKNFPGAVAMPVDQRSWLFNGE